MTCPKRLLAGGGWRGISAPVFGVEVGAGTCWERRGEGGVIICIKIES